MAKTVQSVTKEVSSVTRQVTSSGGGLQVANQRDWNSTLFSCFDDMGGLIMGLFCLPCYAGRASQRIGEHLCVPCCVPGGIITMRTKLRTMLGIEGTICMDCCATLCCPACAVCQMHRELDHVGVSN